MKKPKRLEKGDTIAIISPSWGGPSIFPHVYESGINTLKKLGLKIKEFPSAKADADYLYNNPEFRSKDVNDAFADPEVKAIFTTVGGDDCIRILPYLDMEVIKNNPKILLGYSDTTVLNTILNQSGLVTLNGPSVMAGFSQWDSLPKEFQVHIKQILFENPENYQYKPFNSYCDGYPDWSNKSNVGKTKELKDNKIGWQWLQGKSKIEGELYGGCIEALEFMKSTRFWPEPEFWKGKILFLETSEDKPTPEKVKFMLRNYGMQGIFDKISAIIFGRPRDYSDDEKEKLNKNIIQVVSKEFGKTDLPIIANMDFGHTDPQFILPLGVKARINCINKTFKLKEKIFDDF